MASAWILNLSAQHLSTVAIAIAISIAKFLIVSSMFDLSPSLLNQVHNESKTRIDSNLLWLAFFSHSVLFVCSREII